MRRGRVLVFLPLLLTACPDERRTVSSRTPDEFTYSDNRRAADEVGQREAWQRGPELRAPGVNAPPLAAAAGAVTGLGVAAVVVGSRSDAGADASATTLSDERPR